MNTTSKGAPPKAFRLHRKADRPPELKVLSINSFNLIERPTHKMPNPSSRKDTIRRFDKRPRLGHIGSMSAIAKSRIDPELKRQAEAVLEEIGLKPRAALELFYKQIIKRRAIPFPVQADSPEDDVLSPAARRNQLADEF